MTVFVRINPLPYMDGIYVSLIDYLLAGLGEGRDGCEGREDE